MTLHELFAAIDGHNRAHRIGPEPMTREEFADLEAQYPDASSIKPKRKKANG